jgi:sugar lactone lactonase YvrE
MNTFKFTIVAAILGASIGQASAAIPLNNPKGLALDTKGNLYVANPGKGGTSTGQVLVYNPNYVQQTTKTLGGLGVNGPIGVAVNSKDQIFVANALDWTVTLFNGTKQDTTRTLTFADGIHSPDGISIDGMDNLWISNPTGLGDTNVDVFSFNGKKVKSINFTSYVNTIATAIRGPFLMTATDTYTYSYFGSQLLTGTAGNASGSGVVAEAMTVDTTGKAYLAEFNGDVAIVDPLGKVPAYVLFHVGYGPSGIVVDNTRNRVYVASDDLNQIDVYSTKGVYITTIH